MIQSDSTRSTPGSNLYHNVNWVLYNFEAVTISLYIFLQVLPRQLCNLYTKTYKFEHFASGKEGIMEMAEGGYVFDVLVNNPVSFACTVLVYNLW